MSPSWTSPARWTLRTQILVSVMLLFTLVMLATSGLTVLLTRRHLTDQLSANLTAAKSFTFHDNVIRVPGQGPVRAGGDDGDHNGGGPGAGPDSTLLACFANGQVITAQGVTLNAVGTRGGVTTLDAAQLDELSSAPLGAAPTRVDLGGPLGTYLVTTQPITLSSTGARGTCVIGVSAHDVDETAAETLRYAGLATLLGLGLVGIGGSYLVRRNLEPLARVAATARQVGDLELGSGEVALPARVSARDADPNTEVGQVGHALNTMLDNVEGALKSRQESEQRVRRFVADASHELRTPLASIRGYAELSRREREPVPASVTHALGRVESEALRMQGLVEDLLLLARLDSGRPLEREPVDLTSLAVDSLSDAHAAAPDHRWQLDVPDEPIEVPGDRLRLHQVFANLLANARTHTPAGSTVRLGLRHEGADVRISVRDNGPGIPADMQQRVFERFTRGDDSRQRANGTTGLGLSIVAAVAHAHGGRVEVSSVPGDTLFSVLLPAS